MAQTSGLHEQTQQLIHDLPASWRNILLVEAAADLDLSDFAPTFTTAVNIFARHVAPRRVCRVLLSAEHYKISVPGGSLAFTMSDTVDSCAVESMIFLHTTRISGYPLTIQVAIILEELAHACCGITDETSVKKFVAAMHPGVRYSENHGYVAIQ